MRMEHERGAEFDCDYKLFMSPRASPAREWELVVEEEANISDAKMRDRLLSLNQYIKIGEEYKLEKVEIISLVLASGPMVWCVCIFRYAMHFD